MGSRKSLGARYTLGVLLGLLAGYFPTTTHAGVQSIAAGVTYPTVGGNQFLTLSRSVGYQLEAWMESPIFDELADLHLSAGYQSFPIVNQAGVTNTYFTGLLGFQVQGAERFHRFSPFMGLDFGAAMSTLGVASSTVNSSINLMVQYVPGFDVPLTSRLGVVFQTPIRFVFSRTQLMIFDAVFSVRYRL